MRNCPEVSLVPLAVITLSPFIVGFLVRADRLSSRLPKVPKDVATREAPGVDSSKSGETYTACTSNFPGSVCTHTMEVIDTWTTSIVRSLSLVHHVLCQA